MNTKFETNLKKVFENTEIEDLHFCRSGLSIFKKGSWTIVPEMSPLPSEYLDTLARTLAENASTQVGLNVPALDSHFDYNSEHRFRGHLILPPMSVSGIEITLRRLGLKKQFSLDDFEWINPYWRDFVLEGFQNKKNILICGSTGSGKTSLLKALLNLAPANERIVVLEDSPELFLTRSLLSHLTCRTQRYGSRPGAFWNLEQLVFESLRMRPDRVILGECRGAEATAIAQALFTGHRGIISTIHAGNCKDALNRFALLAQNPQLQFKSWGWDQVVFLRGPSPKNAKRLVTDFAWTK